jgi:hypothetical protein
LTDSKQLYELSFEILILYIFYANSYPAIIKEISEASDYSLRLPCTLPILIGETLVREIIVEE